MLLLNRLRQQRWAIYKQMLVFRPHEELKCFAAFRSYLSPSSRDGHRKLLPDNTHKYQLQAEGTTKLRDHFTAVIKIVVKSELRIIHT